jgi:hypothetical protein
MAHDAVEIVRAANTGKTREADSVRPRSGVASGTRVVGWAAVPVAHRHANVREVVTHEPVAVRETTRSRRTEDAVLAGVLQAVEVVRTDTRVAPFAQASLENLCRADGSLAAVFRPGTDGKWNAEPRVEGELRSETAETAGAVIAIRIAVGARIAGVKEHSARQALYAGVVGGVARIARRHAVALPTRHRPAVSSAALIFRRAFVAGPDLLIERVVDATIGESDPDDESRNAEPKPERARSHHACLT